VEVAQGDGEAGFNDDAGHWQRSKYLQNGWCAGKAMDGKVPDLANTNEMALVDTIRQLREQIAEQQKTITRLSQERQIWYIRATSLEATVERLESELEAALLERDADQVLVRPIFPTLSKSQ